LGDGRRWRIISDACIGCDGETLTVRVFSRVPPAEIRTLHADSHSHTSIALARILWREMYDRTLDVIALEEAADRSQCEAILLIGDKVVTDAPTHLEIETDLGSAWKTLSSLPFVFAAWAAPRDSGLDLSELTLRLSHARDAGVASAELIAADYGPGLGWPVNLAKRYLTQRLKFHLGPREQQGMGRFLELAKRPGIVSPTKELVFA
jgi:chorismate dehydratase